MLRRLQDLHQKHRLDKKWPRRTAGRRTCLRPPRSLGARARLHQAAKQPARNVGLLHFYFFISTSPSRIVIPTNARCRSDRREESGSLCAHGGTMSRGRSEAQAAKRLWQRRRAKDSVEASIPQEICAAPDRTDPRPRQRTRLTLWLGIVGALGCSFVLPTPERTREAEESRSATHPETLRVFPATRRLQSPAPPRFSTAFHSQDRTCCDEQPLRRNPESEELA